MIPETEKVEIIKKMRAENMAAPRSNDYWSSEDTELLRRLFYAGTGISAIAILLHRTEPAVMQRIELNDLYGRRMNPQRRKQAKSPRCLCEHCALYPKMCMRCPHRETLDEEGSNAD